MINPHPEPEPAFEIEIANTIGQVRSKLLTFIDLNPDLPAPARAALVRVVGRLTPLATVDYLLMLRDSLDG